MLGSLEDFQDLIRKGFKYTKPGGWMESQVNQILQLRGGVWKGSSISLLAQEVLSTICCDDGTMPAGWPLAEWIRTLEEASMLVDRPLRIANKLKKWYKEAGFVDIHEQVFKVPCSAWSSDPHLKDLGKVCLVTMPYLAIWNPQLTTMRCANLTCWRDCKVSV